MDRPRSTTVGLGLLLCLHTAAALAVQTAEQQGPRPLHERQETIEDLFERIEGRMVQLVDGLATREPEKAERLREALERAGAQRVRGRLGEIAALLREERYGEAERAQEALLVDLGGLIELLTSEQDHLARMRAERERLNAISREVRAMLEQQQRLQYQTDRAADELDREAGDTPGAPSEELAARLQRLEELQRELQARARELGRSMQADAPPDQTTPGTQETHRAAEQMQRAADALQQQDAQAGANAQEESLEALQRALDQLEEALRQVRREEREGTLASLEQRLRALLAGERAVRTTVERAFADPGGDVAARADARALRREAADMQTSVAEECDLAVRLLVDEGSTVIVPELLRQTQLEMSGLAEDLRAEEAADAAPAPLERVDAIIASLEEILGAVELVREQNRNEPQRPPQQQAGQESRPLLPGSAELKLLRTAQVRLNERSRRLAATADDAGPGLAAEPDAGQNAATALRRLSDRQRRLVELARRMNERD